MVLGRKEDGDRREDAIGMVKKSSESQQSEKGFDQSTVGFTRTHTHIYIL